MSCKCSITIFILSPPLARVVLSQHLTHPQLNLIKLVLLPLVLLMLLLGGFAVRYQYQTAIHHLHRNLAAGIKPRLFKPLALKMYCRGDIVDLIPVRHIPHRVITFCFHGFIYRRFCLRMRLSHSNYPFSCLW
ncbi:hypothetical protein PAU_03001 [Photorhabdus asymbiotica]|uniref:Uncharacterized protein n=1 Tax=Photorhabdus asymbiotica subsp. asymbiotica (strain ATCC 43949 / 3105-77) TaxID=553480 RepID=B6VN41_PHOAA|nr:hypothetical protein PAU_03001 [Photorhabdus asymbiotica]CAR67571.1 Hypothetical protein PA-RVA15-17-1002 [Photorhabdus asymbiotica subsp. asymbiotica ATCC 43949]